MEKRQAAPDPGLVPEILNGDGGQVVRHWIVFMEESSFGMAVPKQQCLAGRLFLGQVSGSTSVQIDTVRGTLCTYRVDLVFPETASKRQPEATARHSFCPPGAMHLWM